MKEVQVDDLVRFSKALKAAGRTGMRKEFHKGMQAAGKPLLAKARKAGRDAMPSGGGLDKRMAKTRFRVQVRTGGGSGRSGTGAVFSGIRVVADGKNVNAKLSNNRGIIRRPVFADAEHETRREWTWVNQRVPGSKGWFDDEMKSSAPVVRPELAKAMDRTIRQIIREV